MISDSNDQLFILLHNHHELMYYILCIIATRWFLFLSALVVSIFVVTVNLIFGVFRLWDASIIVLMAEASQHLLVLSVTLPRWAYPGNWTTSLATEIRQYVSSCVPLVYILSAPLTRRLLGPPCFIALRWAPASVFECEVLCCRVAPPSRVAVSVLGVYTLFA